MIDLVLQQQRRFPYALPVASPAITAGLQTASGLQTAPGPKMSSPQETLRSDGVEVSEGVEASDGVGAAGDTSLSAATTRGVYTHLFSSQKSIFTRVMQVYLCCDIMVECRTIKNIIILFFSL